MKNFRDLKVWEKSHQLIKDVYRATASFPRYELYGLTSQMRRAGTSVPTNIAEGCGRGSDADLGRFMQMSMGSASELEYLFLLSHDLSFLPAAESSQLTSQVVEVKRMLAAFIRKVKGD